MLHRFSGWLLAAVAGPAFAYPPRRVTWPLWCVSVALWLFHATWRRP